MIPHRADFARGGDTAANGKGKLANVTGPKNNFSRYFYYNADGRVSSVGTTINTDTFISGVEYDPTTRRPFKTTYPSAGGSALAVYNSYHASQGYLEKVSSGAGGTGTVYWQATALSAAGHVTQEKLGNGLITQRTYDTNRGWLTGVNTGTTLGGGTVQNENFVYDALGNLTRRSDTLQAYTENFTYDSL